MLKSGRSEAYAMKLHRRLPEEAFVQMGDFVGVAVKHCARRGIRTAIIVGMIGKLSKMADGKMQTHAAGSEVNMGLLGDLAAELGAGPEVCNEIRKANTARQALEICKASGFEKLTSVVCRKVVEHCTRYAGSSLRVQAYLVDFEGAVLGQHPPANSTGEATA